MKCGGALFSVCLSFIREVAVGFGESVAKETSRHQHRRHPSRLGGFWLRLNVCELAICITRGRTGRGYGIFVVVRKGHSTC